MWQRSGIEGAYPQGFDDYLHNGRLTSPRILDFGCGDGRSLIPLFDTGANVWGADPLPTNHERMKQIIDGRLPYPDSHFNLVYSNYVFEHVEDMQEVASEIARVTQSGGIGLHEWPARWCPLERHLKMPFVHWLPKNKMRKAAVGAYMRAGVRPNWTDLPRNDLRASVDRAYEFSVTETFYRSWRDIAKTFTKHGFEVKPVRHHRATSPIVGVPVRAFWTSTLAMRRL